MRAAASAPNQVKRVHSTRSGDGVHKGVCRSSVDTIVRLNSTLQKNCLVACVVQMMETALGGSGRDSRFQAASNLRFWLLLAPNSVLVAQEVLAIPESRVRNVGQQRRLSKVDTPLAKSG